MSESTDEIKEQLLAKREAPKSTIPLKDLLSSGSTTLNLACTGRVTGAFSKGKYYHHVGDSGAGKTFITLTCLAEAARNPNFDDHLLVHDIPEEGALMDFEYFFGAKMAARVQPPQVYADGTPRYSSTLEELKDNLSRMYKLNKPFIYIVDSQDVLPSEKDLARDEKNLKAREKAEKKAVMVELDDGDVIKIQDSYNTDRSKEIHRILRRATTEIKKTGSILHIITQTKDKIAGPGARVYPGADTKTYSGGHALKFYATLELWLSIKEQITKTIKNKIRKIGTRVQVRVKKNRAVGRDRTVVIPIYNSYGIDDLGGCVEYLLDERHWKENGGKINAKEFNFQGSREELIAHIESIQGEKKLRMIVRQVWDAIENACVLQRKPRYE